MAAKTKQPSRTGSPLNVWLPDELLEALKKCVEASRPTTTAKAIVQVAVEDYLASKGFWELPKSA